LAPGHGTAASSELLAEDLSGHIQPFDTQTALAAGSIAATRQSAGRTVEIRDVQLAGVAVCRRATVAARNARHFGQTCVHLVDP
jgi:predicted nucleic acid-binding protein